MIEPTMKATPPRKKSRSQTSAAASRLSARPVIEIAFGVRRDSISRSRISSRRSAALNATLPLRRTRGLSLRSRLVRRPEGCLWGACGGVIERRCRQALARSPLADGSGEAPGAGPHARQALRAVGGDGGRQRTEQRIEDEVVGRRDDHEGHQERVDATTPPASAAYEPAGPAASRLSARTPRASRAPRRTG